MKNVNRLLMDLGLIRSLFRSPARTQQPVAIMSSFVGGGSPPLTDISGLALSLPSAV